MLRKSHSIDWHAGRGPSSAERAGSDGHAQALKEHFDELKAGLDDFNTVFAHWATGRHHALSEDKAAYLATLAEEKGACLLLRRLRLLVPFAPLAPLCALCASCVPCADAPLPL